MIPVQYLFTIGTIKTRVDLVVFHVCSQLPTKYVIIHCIIDGYALEKHCI